jgi:hypothetical protein
VPKYTLVALLLLVTTAFAQLPEVTVFDCPGGVFGSVATLARAWKGTDNHSSYCNKNWTVTFQNQASIAQWMDLGLDSQDLYWRVLKPGEYATSGFNLVVKSNGNVSLAFAGFGDLVNLEGDVVNAFYALVPANQIPTPASWMAAPALNGLQFVFPEVQEHTQLSYAMWNRVRIIECDSACEYKDDAGASITFVLAEQKPWVDGETGTWKVGYPAPPPYPPAP